MKHETVRMIQMARPTPRITAMLAAIGPNERAVYGFLAVALMLFGVIYLAAGPEELQRNHVELGSAILSGTAQYLDTPAYPMFGYALVIALLGPWTLLLNCVAGFAAFVMAFRWLELGRAAPTAALYLGTLGYAALMSSWNDHVLFLCLLLIALAVLHRFGVRDWKTGAVIGLLWGLAYNIRTDALLLFPLFLLSSLVFQWLDRKPAGVIHHASAVVVFMIAMLPWAIYTKSVLGRYSPTTTNGWGVVMLGLGLVPGNRYELQPRDDHLAERVKAIGERDPWSDGSNKYFRAEAIRIVMSDPAYVAKRVFWGIIHAARIGVHSPDIRKAAATSPEHYRRLHTAFQNLKRYFGLPPNYIDAAASRDAVSIYDMMVVFADFALRIILGLTFLYIVARTLLLARHPQQVVSGGAAGVFAASILVYCGFVACVLFSIDRLNTVLLAFAMIFLQRIAVLNAQSALRTTRPMPHADPSAPPKG